MIVYRIADRKYKDDLSGTGAKLIGGRWNSPGLPALYTSEHASLATLEIIVHVNKPEKFQNLFLLYPFYRQQFFERRGFAFIICSVRAAAV